MADGWREKGAETRYEALPGMNHFTVCDPMTDPDSAMTARLVDLAERVCRNLEPVPPGEHDRQRGADPTTTRSRMPRCGMTRAELRAA